VIKKDEMGYTCSTYGKMRHEHKILFGKAKCKKPFGKSRRRRPTGFSWLRTGSNDRVL
jgi:hypothetical protein